MKPYVLIAEDEKAVSELLLYNLRKEDYDVGVAGDGEETLIMLDERTPDLLLLDWMLPKVSGIEICRRVRTGGGNPNLPIIMLTARGEESDRIRGLDTGADDYVTKPFSTTELMARVRAVLRRIRPGLKEDRITVGDIEIDRIAHRVARKGASTSARRNSGCSTTSCSTPAACSRASSYLIRYGARTSMSRRAPSTCMSGACARRFAMAAGMIRSGPCARPATPCARIDGRRKQRPPLIRQLKTSARKVFRYVKLRRSVSA
jgi:CheY-like chemotaxis protein